MSTLLSKVKNLCKERSISISQLEKELDIPHNTIYQWKNKTPKIQRLKLIADFFHVPIEYLIDENDEKSLQLFIQSELDSRKQETAYDNVKKLTIKENISIPALEEELELGKNTIYGWKNKMPKTSNLEKVADFFGVSVDYLLGRYDEEITKNSSNELPKVNRTPFERIKELCKEHKIPLSILEEKLGFSKDYFHSWKRNSPPSEKLEKVADYFGTSTDYLLGRTDKKYIDDIETIAAHHDGEEWTEEELEEIERFKQFVRMKRHDHPKKEG